jgi:hypothetical protein
MKNAVPHVADFLISVIFPMVWSNGHILDLGGRHRSQDTGGRNVALQDDEGWKR